MIKNRFNASDLAVEMTGARHKRRKILGFTATESEAENLKSLTLDIKAAESVTEEKLRLASLAVSSAINEFIPLEILTSNAPVTVICIGNSSLTADSLGPACADRIVTTRHLKTEAPHIFSALGGREISVIKAEPASVSGIDAAELARICVKELKSRMIIAIDALKALNADRLYSAVQISNGITPGSGIGNSRPDISSSALGVPVVAIGVPTAISAVSLISDILGKVISIAPENRVSQSKAFSQGKAQTKYDDFPNTTQSKSDDTFKTNTDTERLFPSTSQVGLLVSPTDGDISVKRYSKIIASAINHTLIGVDTE